MTHEPEGWETQRAELEAWKTAPLSSLVRHIVEKYHREARLEMARLETQIGEAVLLEGRNQPNLKEIQSEVDRFCAELRAHLAIEEKTLFPALLDLSEGRDPQVPKEILEPIRLLEDEHAAAAGLLKRMRALTEGFTPPESARSAQRQVFETLQKLADSLYPHIYLENQILFQRARAAKV